MNLIVLYYSLHEVCTLLRHPCENEQKDSYFNIFTVKHCRVKMNISCFSPCPLIIIFNFFHVSGLYRELLLLVFALFIISTAQLSIDPHKKKRKWLWRVGSGWNWKFCFYRGYMERVKWIKTKLTIALFAFGEGRTQRGEKDVGKTNQNETAFAFTVE